MLVRVLRSARHQIEKTILQGVVPKALLFAVKTKRAMSVVFGSSDLATKLVNAFGMRQLCDFKHRSFKCEGSTDC